MNEHNYLIVTEEIEATKSLVEVYNTKFLKPDAKRGSFLFWKNFLRNFILSFKIIRSFKPDIIITTGSHTAVPMCLLGKVLGKKSGLYIVLCAN